MAQVYRMPSTTGVTYVAGWFVGYSEIAQAWIVEGLRGKFATRAEAVAFARGQAS